MNLTRSNPPIVRRCTIEIDSTAIPSNLGFMCLMVSQVLTNIRSAAVLTLLSIGTLSAYEQGTYFVCLISEDGNAPAGRIGITRSDLEETKTTQKQAPATATERSSEAAATKQSGLDLGALKQTGSDSGLKIFDTSSLFKGSSTPSQK
jgi:hypothetical protein